MKTLLFLLLLSTAVFADNFEGDLYAIDAKASTVTLSAKDKLQTYRVRPDTEIKINGVKAKFTDLAAGMMAKVGSGDPGVATRIEANGTPDPAGAPGTDANANFERRLVGTKWIWLGHHFAFEAGGKVSGDRNFTWKTVKPNVISYMTVDGYHGTVTFERGLTKATVEELTPDGKKASPSLTRDKP